MISVNVTKNRNDEYVGFTCNGHAGYSEYGSDIVCSAVSMLVINTINSIEKFTKDIFICDADDDKGLIQFKFDSAPSKEASLLLDSMVLGISETEKSYGKAYVTLKIKEV